MATEPVSTSAHYHPGQTYTPPVGRLPVLGKIRAEIEKLYAEAGNSYNEMTNRDAAQALASTKTTADIANDNTRTADNTRKITADIAAMEARTTNETNKTNAEVTAIGVQSTNDTTRANNDSVRATNDTNRAVAEVSNSTNKVTAEISLLEQKQQTELAQVFDTVDTGTVTGVIGRQKTLFERQANGFLRDAEQKLAKIMVDTWSVRQTTDGGQLTDQAGIDNNDIFAVLNSARAGLAAGGSPDPGQAT